MGTIKQARTDFVHEHVYWLLIALGVALLVATSAVVLGTRPTKTEVAYEYANKVVAMREAINARQESWYAMDREDPTLSREFASKELCASAGNEGGGLVCGQGEDLKALMDEHLNMLVR